MAAPKVSIHRSTSDARLADTPWTYLSAVAGTESEFDLEASLDPEAVGRFLELRVVLVSQDRATNPHLRRVDLHFSCDAPVD